MNPRFRSTPPLRWRPSAIAHVQFQRSRLRCTPREGPLKGVWDESSLPIQAPIEVATIGNCTCAIPAQSASMHAPRRAPLKGVWDESSLPIQAPIEVPTIGNCTCAIPAQTASMHAPRRAPSKGSGTNPRFRSTPLLRWRLSTIAHVQFQRSRRAPGAASRIDSRTIDSANQSAQPAKSGPGAQIVRKILAGSAAISSQPEAISARSAAPPISDTYWLKL
jgi:hypothetical protein